MKNISVSSADYIRSWRNIRKIVLKQIPKTTGNNELYLKAVIMITLWLLPFVLFLNLALGYWLSALLAVISGAGMAGVGMNIMHDASHGSFSSKNWVNELFAKSIILLAGDDKNWKKQHVHIHHEKTNIHNHDDDIDSKGLFRFTKEQPWKPMHRFQVFYAIPAYSLMTLMWATTKDFFQKKRYLANNSSMSFFDKLKEYLSLSIKKIMYYSFWIVLPLVVGVSWKFVLVFFLLQHIVAGLLSTLTFQLAHVVPKAQSFDVDYSQSDKLIHQLVTSCNFATQNRFIFWFTGGLNHQKEHHVFPNISHIHYPKISEYIRKFCKEKNVVYSEYRTLWSAIKAHFRHLYKMGEESKKEEMKIV